MTESSVWDDTEARQIGSEPEFDRIVESTDDVLVSFTSEWCRSCQSMVPVLNEIATETDTSVLVVDVEELPELANRYDVRLIPTYLTFDRGSVSDRHSGAQQGTDLRELLDG